MTVAELVKHLQTLPQNATVMRQGDEYKGDERYCYKVEYRPKAGLGVVANSVLID